MRHRTFRLGQLRLNGIRVDVRYGDLLVALPDSTDQFDWEVVVTTNDTLTLEQAPYDVHMHTSEEGRELWGPGILVRTDGHAHVFRGGGSLDGFTTEDFDT